ncbi:ShlB/FhaC/HecB family hemolysin secretion/activation protein [uncultured Roseibium sp.]|uniref:ShlB/FhaC/HecB family hemolysin secretion/activation protein n=1 Tax=uncultured Roseibium sp. TaxID=1936171 RepID=UPI00261C029D|nr:ShlB/FhaC/HecB family hemolysin secretion/activation protein [uncultured Roseibium sp.]
MNNVKNTIPISAHKRSPFAHLALQLIRKLFIVFLFVSSSSNVHSTPRLSGVSIYDPDHLLAFAYQHARLQSGVVQSDSLARSIELIYREDGYFLAEVEVLRNPDSNSQTFRVVEGYIETISIEGVEERLFQKIRGYVQHLTTERPLRLSTYERAIMLARDLAGVHLTTEIDYPEGQSGAHLRILATTDSQSGSIQIDNPPREFGKAVSGFLNQEFYSTLIAGDLLRFEAGATAFDTLDTFANDGHSLYGAITYRAPIGRQGTYVEGYFGNALGRREANGSLVTTDQDGLNGVLALGHPFLRNAHEYGYALIEARYADSNSEGGGLKYRSAVDTAALALLYGNANSRGGATEVAVNLSLGMRAGPEPADIDDGDDEFWHLRAGLGHIEPLNFLHQNLYLNTEIWGQITSNSLPAVEEIYLGDRYSLRGFRFDEAQGDIGLIGKFELALDLTPEADWINRFEPFVFLDTGTVGNLDARTHERDHTSLISTGFGWSSTISQHYFVNGWFGVPLTDGPETGQFAPAFYLTLGRSW